MNLAKDGDMVICHRTCLGIDILMTYAIMMCTLLVNK